MKPKKNGKNAKMKTNEKNNTDEKNNQKETSEKNEDVKGNTCEIVHAQLSMYQDEELSTLETNWIETHLAHCETCTRLLSEYVAIEKMADVLQSSLEQVDMEVEDQTLDLWPGIHRKIQAEEVKVDLRELEQLRAEVRQLRAEVNLLKLERGSAIPTANPGKGVLVPWALPAMSEVQKHPLL